MCLCNPSIRSPWCGKPGCQMPPQPKTFPILSRWQWERNLPKELVEKVPHRVPWALVQGHEKQADRNHSQTLDGLASRGGLSPAELYCVLHDLPFYKRPLDEVQITEARAAQWLVDKLANCESGQPRPNNPT